MPSPPFELSIAIRDGFRAAGESDVFDKTLQSVLDLGRFREDFVYYGNPESISKLDQAIANCRVAQQAHLHRVENLVAGAMSCFVENNTHSFALLTRGIYESAAVLGYICNRVRSCQLGNILFDDLADDIAFVIMGAKEKTFGKAPNPPNIMTCLEKADKYLNDSFFEQKVGALIDNYNWLSEWAHPNFLSNHASMRIEKDLGGFSFLRVDVPPIKDSGLLQYLTMAVDLFAATTEGLKKLIDERISGKNVE